MAESLKTVDFPLFPRLPPELRHMVWQFALSDWSLLNVCGILGHRPTISSKCVEEDTLNNTSIVGQACHEARYIMKLLSLHSEVQVPSTHVKPSTTEEVMACTLRVEWSRSLIYECHRNVSSCACLLNIQHLVQCVDHFRAFAFSLRGTLDNYKSLRNIVLVLPSRDFSLDDRKHRAGLEKVLRLNMPSLAAAIARGDDSGSTPRKPGKWLKYTGQSLQHGSKLLLEVIESRTPLKIRTIHVYVATTEGLLWSASGAQHTSHTLWVRQLDSGGKGRSSRCKEHMYDGREDDRVA